jgi:NADH-quinone oxidoreductase subunit G
MSAQPTNNVAPDLVNIEIDGKAMQVPKNSMIIQAADAAGIAIPRFCYHPKLAIAANCRMCLVEVEMGGKPMPKPQPACATPVAEGMKVATRSDKALHWQRDVMEFLLINHPLDCPICDQGGECELQDLALGYGRSVSRFTERKRTVADENLGPLIATEMTRCIQCTRCVRFLGEVAGTDELGGMGRGEHLEIGTYIGKSIGSEIGGNIIDVCPVGALTDKVFQFKARAWEMIARPSLGAHDALGSNLWLHTLRGRILRAVPRDNEAVNECWLSDRDRYSHQGLYAADRALKPMVKRDGAWHETDWDDALNAAAQILKAAAGADLGVLAHPASSCEEGELLKRLARGLGSANLDHRLRQINPQGGASTFECAVPDMARAGAVLLIGSHVRHELPLVNRRIRQAALRGGKVYAVNPVDFDFNYPLAGRFIAPPQSLVDALLKLTKAAQSLGGHVVDAALRDALAQVEADDAATQAVQSLKDATGSVVLLGEIAAMHPQAAWLRAAARLIADATGSALDETPLGANAVGLSRIGVLPGANGLDARAMQLQPRKAYVLFGAEPPDDFADGKLALDALRGAKVVAFATFHGDALKDVADVILPISAPAETDATLVNLDGHVQQAQAGANPPGEARPGWRVLRALGGLLKLDGFGFTDIGTLRGELALSLQQPVPASTLSLTARPTLPSTGLTRLATVPIYRGDAVLRRAAALNAHPLARPAEVVLGSEDARALGFADGQRVRVTGGTVLPLRVDARVPAGTVWIECAHERTAQLLPFGATLSLDKA